MNCVWMIYYCSKVLLNCYLNWRTRDFLEERLEAMLESSGFLGLDVGLAGLFWWDDESRFAFFMSND